MDSLEPFSKTSSAFRTFCLRFVVLSSSCRPLVPYCLQMSSLCRLVVLSSLCLFFSFCRFGAFRVHVYCLFPFMGGCSPSIDGVTRHICRATSQMCLAALYIVQATRHIDLRLKRNFDLVNKIKISVLI